MRKIYKGMFKLYSPSTDGRALDFSLKAEDIVYAVELFNEKYSNFKEIKILSIDSTSLSILFSIRLESENVNVDGRDLSYFSKRLYDDKKWDVFSTIPNRLFNIALTEATESLTNEYDEMEIIPASGVAGVLFETREYIDDEAEDEDIQLNYSITSYGADYDIEGLVKKLEKGRIYIPRFQRQYVWKIDQASRFIESLLMGLPVPGVFLSKKEDTSELLIIDGQQRLRTLEYYYKGIFEPSGRKFKLTNVNTKFNGKSYNELEENERARLDESIIHATIIKQDEPSDDDSSIFYIFERINTGGTQLTPQEIRACIYSGEFSNLLRELQLSKSWANIYGNPNLKLKDQELILRFFALYYDWLIEKVTSVPLKQLLLQD